MSVSVYGHYDLNKGERKKDYRALIQILLSDAGPGTGLKVELMHFIVDKIPFIN
jgi:hypothetical protein